MLKKKSDIPDSIRPMLVLLPRSFATNIYIGLVKLFCRYELFWLEHYVALFLKQNGRFEEMVRHIEQNPWCPRELPSLFTAYVTSNYPQQVNILYRRIV